MHRVLTAARERRMRVMKTTSRNETASRKASETLKTEYRFDYTKLGNRFAGGVSKSVVVLLDPDVAKVFKNAESVNSVCVRS